MLSVDLLRKCRPRVPSPLGFFVGELDSFLPREKVKLLPRLRFGRSSSALGLFPLLLTTRSLLTILLAVPVALDRSTFAACISA